MKLAITLSLVLAASVALGSGDSLPDKAWSCECVIHTDRGYITPDGVDLDATWLREGIARQVRQFRRVTYKPCPGRPAIAAVNYEEEELWWGNLRVFHHTGDQIDWMAGLPELYSKDQAHYLLSLDWHYLRRLRIWVLQVFDSTHRGNGSLWLFTLKGHHLRLLLHTVATGQYWGAGDGGSDPHLPIPIPEGSEAWFVEDHLNVEYRVTKDASFESVFLTGTIAVGDMDHDKMLATKSYMETWAWDPVQRIFTRVVP